MQSKIDESGTPRESEQAVDGIEDHDANDQQHLDDKANQKIILDKLKDQGNETALEHDKILDNVEKMALLDSMDSESAIMYDCEDPESPLTQARYKYEMVKFIGVIIYGLSFMTTIGYFSTSRFCSVYVYKLFLWFLIIRPVVVTLYSWVIACTTIQDVRF